MPKNRTNSFKQKQEPVIYNTNVERDRIPVMFEGEKVGMADVSRTGIVSMLITSPILANKFGRNITEHIAIVPKNKE
jgi:hypothetical protein